MACDPDSVSRETCDELPVSTFFILNQCILIYQLDSVDFVLQKKMVKIRFYFMKIEITYIR